MIRHKYSPTKKYSHFCCFSWGLDNLGPKLLNHFYFQSCFMSLYFPWPWLATSEIPIWNTEKYLWVSVSITIRLKGYHLIGIRRNFKSPACLWKNISGMLFYRCVAVAVVSNFKNQFANLICKCGFILEDGIYLSWKKQLLRMLI